MLRAKSSKFNSILVSADSNQELGDTFMRFQEHYESPNPDFRNKIFTRGQYLTWYSKEYGANTYSKDWSGYNFPSYILKPFKDGLFDPLTTKEQELVNLFRYRTDSFYIIGANDESTIRHELAHALYYTNKEYRKQIDQLLISNNIESCTDHLLKRGYTKEVIYDEIQAYVTDNDNNEVIQNISGDIANQINSIYEKYDLDKDETV